MFKTKNTISIRLLTRSTAGRRSWPRSRAALPRSPTLCRASAGHRRIGLFPARESRQGLRALRQEKLLLRRRPATLARPLSAVDSKSVRQDRQRASAPRAGASHEGVDRQLPTARPPHCPDAEAQHARHRTDPQPLAIAKASGLASERTARHRRSNLPGKAIKSQAGAGGDFSHSPAIASASHGYKQRKKLF